MSVRWKEVDLARAVRNIRQSADVCAGTRQSYSGNVAVSKTSKYRNTRVNWQGQKFDSKHELKKFQEFELERLSGRLRAVVRQVSLQLPQTTRRIRIDFMLVENDGQIRWVDAKGVETPAWQFKRDQVKQAFGLTIETV